jgi:hypothetical protein
MKNNANTDHWPNAKVLTAGPKKAITQEMLWKRVSEGLGFSLAVKGESIRALAPEVVFGASRGG